MPCAEQRSIPIRLRCHKVQQPTGSTILVRLGHDSWTITQERYMSNRKQIFDPLSLLTGTIYPHPCAAAQSSIALPGLLHRVNLDDTATSPCLIFALASTPIQQSSYATISPQPNDKLTFTSTDEPSLRFLKYPNKRAAPFPPHVPAP